MRVPTIRRCDGFSMIELMVALAVLAVLLAAATPSFADYFERYRLRSAVDDTLNLFAAARQGAVEADRNVNITFAADPANWCVGGVQQADPAEYAPVATNPADCGCAATPNSCVVNGDRLVVDAAGRPGVTLDAGGDSFTYNSKNGTLTDLTLTPSVDFVSSSGRYGLSILVTPLGHARACVTAGKRPIPGYSNCG